MTLHATVALIAASLAVYVALLSHRFSLAPGWRDQRWFALAALSVAAYACLDIATTSSAPRAVVIWCARGGASMASLHVYGWIRYSDANLAVRPSRVRAVLDKIPLILAGLALVPGAILSDRIKLHRYAPLGTTYRDVVPTPFGEIAFALVFLCLPYIAARYALAWRRGVPQAALHLFAVAYLALVGANDILVSTGHLASPYLINLGFIVPIAAVAYSVSVRFTGDARALSELRGQLEAQVQERTQALAHAQEQLFRSEKLAALGQFSAGVAHEVNNPAAVVAANLSYLLSCRHEEGTWPEDASECLTESISAVDRITAIVRQLLDAGRLAAAPAITSPVVLAPAVTESVAMSHARCGNSVPVRVEIEKDVRVVAQETLLVQVLANLIVNAIQAIPADRPEGRVLVRAEQIPNRVRLTVEDNGTGMSPEVLRRVFEPFFSTKPLNRGTGLGLAVSRGMVESLGGDLRLESTLGVGTCAVVELPAAPPEPPPPLLQATVLLDPAAEGLGPRILLIDDEPAVVRALGRVLRDHYRVESASTVEEALARAASEPFDIVLCDVMMPDGGAERLCQELERSAPEIARRVVLVTGGATSEAARRFLAGASQPLLEKPLDLSALAAIVEQVAAVHPPRQPSRTAGDA
jgi:signal transduction histidine kinase/CheY-like chemotaxis protein